MTKITNGKNSLILGLVCSITLATIIGVMVQTTTTVDAYEESNQYVPFKITGPDNPVTCADADQDHENDLVSITSANDKDFLVTSILIGPSGIANAGDIYSVGAFSIDGVFMGVNTGDLAIDQPWLLGSASEVLGRDVPGQWGGAKTPQQIGLTGNDGLTGDAKDLQFGIFCSKAGKNVIHFETDRIIVTGWKHVDDTITLNYSE